MFLKTKFFIFFVLRKEVQYKRTKTTITKNMTSVTSFHRVLYNNITYNDLKISIFLNKKEILDHLS